MEIIDLAYKIKDYNINDNLSVDDLILLLNDLSNFIQEGSSTVINQNRIVTINKLKQQLFSLKEHNNFVSKKEVYDIILSIMRVCNDVDLSIKKYKILVKE